MDGREKVIKGLEICSEHGSWHGLDCEHNEANVSEVKMKEYYDWDDGCYEKVTEEERKERR